MKYKIEVDEIFETELTEELLDTLDISPALDGSGLYHMLLDGKSYMLELIDNQSEDGKYLISVNGFEHWVVVTDRWKQLISSMGLDKKSSKKLSELKSPMPGAVKQVLVKPGEEVEEGATLIVMEAMKMENLLKCPSAQTIKSVEVKPGQVVEKGALLIRFGA